MVTNAKLALDRLGAVSGRRDIGEAGTRARVHPSRVLVRERIPSKPFAGLEIHSALEPGTHSEENCLPKACLETGIEAWLVPLRRTAMYVPYRIVLPMLVG